jgi:hypothetical protein
VAQIVYVTAVTQYPIVGHVLVTGVGAVQLNTSKAPGADNCNAASRNGRWMDAASALDVY